MFLSWRRRVAVVRRTEASHEEREVD